MSQLDQQFKKSHDPAKPRFQQRVQALRKRESIAALLDLFSEKGSFEFRVEDVASVQGIAKGTIYNMFRSKEELLRSALEELHSAALSEYERRAVDLSKEATAVSKLILMAEVLLGLDGRCKSLFNQLPCSLGNMGHGPMHHEFVELIGFLIEESSALPADGIPRTGLAELFIGIVGSRPMHEMTRRVGAPQTSQTAVNLFLYGMCPPQRG